MQLIPSILKLSASFLFLFGNLFAHTISDGKILLKIKNGQDAQAFSDYQEKVKVDGKHDFELVHRMALGIIDYGFRQKDPEIQLLALFGASISAHEDAYYILEESLKNRFPQIQLVGLKALASLNNDRADQAILRAMGSEDALVRLEAVQHLCQKKHPQAVNQTESFMYKLPATVLPIFPPLYAQAGTPQATILLRKMFNHTSNEVRVSVILSAAQYGRDDLLPQIRQQATHYHYSQQEACAAALGIFQDEASRPKLIKLTKSQYPSVALAAHVALYELGQEEAAEAIELAAAKGDVFAIAALGAIPERSSVLLQGVKDPNLQIRINSIIALLHQQNPLVAPYLKEILIRDKRDFAFSEITTPGKAFKAWKVTPSASHLLKNDASAFLENIELKEMVLTQAQRLSQGDFINLANEIFSKEQNDLVPLLVDLLEDASTPEATQCLKTYQQKLGAPLIRNYCTLALYRMQEAGPYGEQLRKWMKAQNKAELIRFEAFVPWQIGKNSYELTPEQTSKLLIKACEALAMNQDDEGIGSLIEAISSGHEKNKYALAGLLLRATQ